MTKSWSYLIGLSVGHMVKHFYQQGILLLIPFVKASLGLTDVQVGLLGTSRTIFSSAMNIPAGIMADVWRDKISVMLTASLLSLSVGYFLLGIAPNFIVVFLGIDITGMGTSLWHAPAFGSLAVVYPDRKATAMAGHRMGGSIGDTLSPFIIGALLGGISLPFINSEAITWNSLSLILSIPVAICALLVAIFFKNKSSIAGESLKFREYLVAVVPLFQNKAVLSMVLLSGIRGMSHNSLSIFLMIYMVEDLGFGSFTAGFHLALLTLFGVLSAPLMGIISDKKGRRPIIFTALAVTALLVFLLIPFGSGITLTIILALLGTVLYTVNPIMLATALDSANKGTEGSATSFMFTGAAIFSAFGPVFAGFLKQTYGSMDAVFWFVGIMMAISAITTLIIPMKVNQ
jgi:FSR family fosmidomycin resistance protein-like MFS transporter